MSISDWTTLYTWTWTWGAWIFRDSTNWLISLSSDWGTWITIADKNLWATVVYNTWDTLSIDNSWYYYQRWNNYWFNPFTWWIQSSTTQVDTTWYWPWNFYESSTFIDGIYWWFNDWSNPSNPDLWWWVTWKITLNNVISNTWVTSVNWQTWDVTISMWSENVYCTQEEYDALPSSKLTDWKSYFIY